MIGDTFPYVPVKDFQMKAKRTELHALWPIIGPTVELNMRGKHPAELWELFALCYLQGLENGYLLREATP